MRGQLARIVLGFFVCVLLGAVVRSQDRGRQDSPNLADPSQIVAVRAARIFDANAGAMRAGQTLLIRGDRIVEVGPSVQVPQGARVIDLGAATLMPGMIDAHVHTAGPTPGESFEHRTFVMVQSAQRDLDAVFEGARRAGVPPGWLR